MFNIYIYILYIYTYSIYIYIYNHIFTHTYIYIHFLQLNTSKHTSCLEPQINSDPRFGQKSISFGAFSTWIRSRHEVCGREPDCLGPAGMGQSGSTEDTGPQPRWMGTKHRRHVGHPWYIYGVKGGDLYFEGQMM